MTIDPNIQEADAQLAREFPLPLGCTVARYVGDMREIVQYKINNDTYGVCHDWIEAGKRMVHRGEDIYRDEWKFQPIDDVVRLRLLEVFKVRGFIA